MRDVIIALPSMELYIQEAKYFKIFCFYTSGNENNAFILLSSKDLIFNVVAVFLRKLFLKIICWNSCGAWIQFSCCKLACSVTWKYTRGLILQSYQQTNHMCNAIADALKCLQCLVCV